MKTVQYTLRSVPIKLDQHLRARARRSGKSLNAVVIATLVRAEGLDTDLPVYHDLDWFIGGKTLDKKAFEATATWLDDAPNDLV